ncbi:DUF3561 family protein [Sodalis sp. dw_96]|uniref:DUF3561 family protein n=1 Tax=Sodalis sp. dw_96 TaxID=2719794 RepID=UPI001BD5EF57|nr:DUF3561 family protein [Sodalis sp. dw_96]
MLNVTQSKHVIPVTVKPISARGSERGTEEPAYGFWGAMAGFLFYWVAFAVPILVYGANALFFLLYTWPFFLALLPLSVLIGIIVGTLLAARIWLMILCSGLSIFSLFWLVFSLLTGW